MCFLRRPEGELQSSPSWPLHHPSDTDRLHHPRFLTAFEATPFRSSCSFPSHSIHPNLIFCSFFFFTRSSFSSCPLFCCSTPSVFALQVLIKSASFDPSMMSSAQPVFCYFFLSFLSALPFLLLSLCIMQEQHLNPQRSLSLLMPAHSPVPRSFLTFLSLLHPFLPLAPKTCP